MKTLKPLFATIILALAFVSVQASNITISGEVRSADNLFSFRPIYIILTDLYKPVPPQVVRIFPLWPGFVFTQVYPGDKYTVRAWSPKGGLVFEPGSVLLDEPQDNVAGIVFTYQSK